MELERIIRVFVRRESGGNNLFKSVVDSIEGNQEALEMVTKDVIRQLGSLDTNGLIPLEGSGHVIEKVLKLEHQIKRSIVSLQREYITECATQSIEEFMEVHRNNTRILDSIIAEYFKLFFIAKHYRGVEQTLTELNMSLEEASQI